MASLLVLGVAVVASAFMAWSIGAGSSGSTPFAPAVGANAISILRAGFVVGILGLTGAVLQGANVTEAVGRELIRGVAITPVAASVGLLVAAGLVAAGVFRGYPIATAFTVTGAMIGAGLALGGAPAWAKYQEIAALWVLTPIVGGGVAYLIARLLAREDVPLTVAIPLLSGLVGLILANIEVTGLGPDGSSASFTGAVASRTSLDWGLPVDPVVLVLSLSVAVVAWGLVVFAMARDPVDGQRRFLLALGGLVAFSAGGSQVGLAIGPLLPLMDEGTIALPLGVVLFGGGIGLLAGSWTAAPRMIKALSQDYASLGPRRSIAALIPSFAIAQTAVFYGIPVSFNEIIVSAIIGSGYAAGGEAVSGSKMGYTVLAWIASLGGALGVSYVGVRLVGSLVG